MISLQEEVRTASEVPQLAAAVAIFLIHVLLKNLYGLEIILKTTQQRYPFVLPHLHLVTIKLQTKFLQRGLYKMQEIGLWFKYQKWSSF